MYRSVHAKHEAWSRQIFSDKQTSCNIYAKLPSQSSFDLSFVDLRMYTCIPLQKFHFINITHTQKYKNWTADFHFNLMLDIIIVTLLAPALLESPFSVQVTQSLSFVPKTQKIHNSI